MITSTAIHAGTVLVLRKLERVGECEIVGGAGKCKKSLILPLCYSHGLFKLLLPSCIELLLLWPLTLFSATFGIAIWLGMSGFATVLASYIGF